MGHLLQTAAGTEMMSILDGFLGYNQIQVDEANQFKIAFTTPWGIFSYNRMFFGLTNVGETFQQAMNLAFGYLKDKIIIVPR